MFCNCKDSRFTNEAEQCKCCYTRPNVRGKFGVAYLIDTPTNKCDPCGWEVEFNDTPSQVDYNCKRMMNWVSCPPLGGCQNNSTKMRCCSDAEQLLNVQEDICCPCKPRKTSCCCEKPSPKLCCCEKPKQNTCYPEKQSYQRQISCCCNNQNGDKQECCQPKLKYPCCKAADGQRKYFQSVKKCCCKLPKSCNCCKNENMQCCKCNTTKIKKNYCCYNSDSSSDDSCNCNRAKNCCDCHQKSKSKKKETTKKDINHNKNKSSKNTNNITEKQHSKNLDSPILKGERNKVTDRTPYTITNDEIFKKEPDKEQTIKTQLELFESEVKNIDYKEETPQNKDIVLESGDNEKKETI